MIDLTEAEAANELMRLAKQIARHNKLYHAEDAPEISDAEYDALVRRNAEIEAEFPHLIRDDSPSRQVGAEIGNTPLSKVEHAERLYSLDNGFSDEEIAEFARIARGMIDAPTPSPSAAASRRRASMPGWRIRGF